MTIFIFTFSFVFIFLHLILSLPCHFPSFLHTFAFLLSLSYLCRVSPFSSLPPSLLSHSLSFRLLQSGNLIFQSHVAVHLKNLSFVLSLLIRQRGCSVGQSLSITLRFIKYVFLNVRHPRSDDQILCIFSLSNYVLISVWEENIVAIASIREGFCA